MSLYKNLTQLPIGFQLKFKVKGDEVQPFALTLREALSLRNKYYLKNNYRPKGLYVKFFHLDVVREVNTKEKSGNITTRYQAHLRRLIDRNYSPVQRSSKVEALKIASQWLPNYNAIASIYNGKRELKFLNDIEIELKILTPRIITKFDENLWRECAINFFGSESSVPVYFKEDQIK